MRIKTFSEGNCCLVPNPVNNLLESKIRFLDWDKYQKSIKGEYNRIKDELLKFEE
jgi:hypothetical protein